MTQHNHECLSTSALCAPPLPHSTSPIVIVFRIRVLNSASLKAPASSFHTHSLTFNSILVSCRALRGGGSIVFSTSLLLEFCNVGVELVEVFALLGELFL